MCPIVKHKAMTDMFLQMKMKSKIITWKNLLKIINKSDDDKLHVETNDLNQNYDVYK